MSLGFTLKPFFEFLCGKDGVIPVKDVCKNKCWIVGAIQNPFSHLFFLGIFVYAGMVTDYNSRENSIIVSLQGFNYGTHMNRRNRSNLVYALGTHSKAGIVRTTLFQKRGKLEMALARRKAGQSTALSS